MTVGEGSRQHGTLQRAEADENKFQVGVRVCVCVHVRASGFVLREKCGGFKGAMYNSCVSRCSLNRELEA